MTQLSVLDLAPIVEGGDAAQAFARSLDLARHAERWGYRRFWLAEHHNLAGVASAATSVVIAHVAGGTSTIRVGAGGVMLPNHAPLVIAEQFGTLASLFPGRVDLGVGRAPGTDPVTSRALRRSLAGDVDQFPNDVLELLAYLAPEDLPEDAPERGAAPPHVEAVPGKGLDVPVWILGSSLYGAELAALFGLPYAFASHFAPAQLVPAIDRYRARFRPSRHLDKPYVMLGVNVFAADDADDAHLSFTSVQQAFANLRRGRPGKLPPPRKGFAQTLAPHEQAMLDEFLSCTFVGTKDDVKAGLRKFADRTRADELIVATQMFDHDKRLRSYELAADALS